MSPEIRKLFSRWTDEEVRLFDAILDNLAVQPVPQLDEYMAARRFERQETRAAAITAQVDARRDRRERYLAETDRPPDTETEQERERAIGAA